jgi:hypothetical protein
MARFNRVRWFVRQRLLGFVVLILALAVGTTSPRTQSRVDVPQRVSERAGAGESVPVIVGVNAAFVPEGFLAGADAVASQRDAIAVALDDVMARAAATGAIIGSSYEILPYFTARADRAALEALATMPGVISIAENVLDRADLSSSIPIVNVSPSWAAGITGANWAVAVIDTGIEKTHSFLAPGGVSKVTSEACYMNAGGTGTGSSTCPGGGFASTAVGSGVPCNANSCDHGTHVAGIAAGVNAGGTGVNGVAPGASLIALQAFTRFDSSVDCGSAPTPCALSYVSDQVLALTRTATLAGAGNVNQIAAVNMSLGGGQFFDQATCDANGANTTTGRKAAIDNLRSLGIAVVASSGNSSYRNALGSPGCISSAVSVGSITDAGLVSSFSNNAPFLSLFAPGSDITSATTGNGFVSKNGTSMAAPHVAGAWAVLKQAVPGASVTQVLTALQSTGTIINDTRTSPSGGTPHPLINVNAARTALLGGGGGGVPGPPVSFAASVNGNNVGMAWSPPSTGGAPLGYQLVVRFTPGGPIATTFTLGLVTGFGPIAAPNGAYSLSVRAGNALGFGPESNVVNITVPTLPPPPGPPTGLVANVTGNSATLNWAAPASGGAVANYVLIAGQTPGFTTPLATLTLGATPGAVINGIPPGTWYVRILARNAGGNSAASNEVQLVVAGPQPPGTPTMNTPTVTAGNTVNLSWTPGAGGTPSSYNLVVRLSPAGPVFAQFALSVTAVSFSGVPSGTYYLQVIANNALGSSGLSNQVTLVVP